MKIAYKHFATILSLALANAWWGFQPSCLGAQQTPVNPAERLRVLGAEDSRLAPIDQARPFSSSMLAEATTAGLKVMATSKVTSRTNQFFAELQQKLALEATEAQLLDFLQNVSSTNSSFHVQTLRVCSTPDRSRLQVNMSIAGYYRLPAAGQPSDDSQTDLVLSPHRHLRYAALDCYTLTKSLLPSGWQLNAFNLQDGKRLSAQGQAPTDQVALLEEVRAKFEKVQSQNGNNLFSSGEATMRMATPGTNFLWSMEFELRPPELR